MNTEEVNERGGVAENSLDNMSDFKGFQLSPAQSDTDTNASRPETPNSSLDPNRSVPNSLLLANQSTPDSLIGPNQSSRPVTPTTDQSLQSHTNDTDPNIMVMLQTMMTQMTQIAQSNDHIKTQMTQTTQRIDDLSNKFDKVSEEMKSRTEIVEVKLSEVCERVEHLELEVQTKHDLCVKLINDKCSVVSNESKKNRDNIAELKVAVDNVESDLKVVASTSREGVDKNMRLIDRCINKQKNFEDRYESEAIVVNNRIESLEKDRPNIDEEIKKLSKKIESKITSIGLGNFEVKSLSTISANAELFLVKFENEQSGIHPMTFLKYVDKFVEVSGDNWEVQLLNIIKYLRGEPENWARQNLDKLNTFENFKREFKKKYWGVIRQRQFEHELMGQGEFNNSRLDFATYVLKYYDINKMLDKPMTIEMFLNYICKHVPESLGASIQSVMTVKEIKNEQEMEAMCRNIGLVRERESLPNNTNRGLYNKGNREQYQKYDDQPYKRENFKSNQNNDREVKVKAQVAEVVEQSEQSDNQRDREPESREKENQGGNQFQRGGHRGRGYYRGNNNRYYRGNQN